MGAFPVSLNRRQFILRSTALMAATGLALNALPAWAQEVDVDKLMEPGLLPENSMGPEDAKLTIVEYASMTCGHCAHFHKTTYPHLKKEYIDTGKVRFVFREFPLDPVAAGAFMLARSVPRDKYFDVIDIMFEQQRTWAFTDDPYNAMLKLAQQIGFTKESFEKTLSDQKLLEGIEANRERASKEFGVNATPTFFFNGNKVSGALTVAQLDEEVAKYL
jgi:protein-disulfide isomerase